MAEKLEVSQKDSIQLCLLHSNRHTKHQGPLAEAQAQELDQSLVHFETRHLIK